MTWHNSMMVMKALQLWQAANMKTIVTRMVAIKMSLCTLWEELIREVFLLIVM